MTKFKVSSYSLGPKKLLFAKCYNTINFMFPVSTPFYTDTSLILVLRKALENYVSSSGHNINQRLSTMNLIKDGK